MSTSTEYTELELQSNNASVMYTYQCQYTTLAGGTQNVGRRCRANLCIFCSFLLWIETKPYSWSAIKTIHQGFSTDTNWKCTKWIWFIQFQAWVLWLFKLSWHSAVKYVEIICLTHTQKEFHDIWIDYFWRKVTDHFNQKNTFHLL